MTVAYGGRGHKFHAKNCAAEDATCGRHPSLKQHRRYQELRLLERAGYIRNLREEVRMNLCESVAGDCAHKRPITYVADFQYEERQPAIQDCANGGKCETCRDCWPMVYEDTKGMETPVFKIKKHLLLDQGIALRVT